MAEVRINAADDPPSMLIVLLDVNLYAWSQIHPSNVPSFLLHSIVEQVLLFLNTFLLLHNEDRVAVILHEPSGAKAVFPSPDPEKQTEGEDDALDGLGIGPIKINDPAILARGLKEAVVDSVKQSVARQLKSSSSKGGRSGISAALSMALCLLNRRRLCLVRKTSAGKNRAPATDIDLATTDETSGQARILTIFAGKDSPAQYVPIMNCIFSAQRMGILIDACSLNPSIDSTYLQQAAYLTNGVYLRPKLDDLMQPESLLQNLLTVFLPDTKSRELLSMPRPKEVDFRASCFTTKKVIDEGRACSVCLSTFDLKVTKRAASCSVCGARYPIPRRLKPPMKNTK